MRPRITSELRVPPAFDSGARPYGYRRTDGLGVPKRIAADARFRRGPRMDGLRPVAVEPCARVAGAATGLVARRNRRDVFLASMVRLCRLSAPSRPSACAGCGVPAVNSRAGLANSVAILGDLAHLGGVAVIAGAHGGAGRHLRPVSSLSHPAHPARGHGARRSDRSPASHASRHRRTRRANPGRRRVASRLARNKGGLGAWHLALRRQQCQVGGPGRGGTHAKAPRRCHIGKARPVRRRGFLFRAAFSGLPRISSFHCECLRVGRRSADRCQGGRRLHATYSEYPVGSRRACARPIRRFRTPNRR